MYVVALTGGIGCGKSEAAKIFAELGVPIVDLDVISHQITAANQPLNRTIAAQFGIDYITAEGALNRVAMRKLIFSDSLARERLNAILHPAIYHEALQQLQQNAQATYQMLAIPLLDSHSQYLAAIDRILLIDCDESMQIARVKARNQLSETEILQIIAAQTPRPARIDMADDVIENNETLTKFREKILRIHQKYLNNCRNLAE